MREASKENSFVSLDRYGPRHGNRQESNTFHAGWVTKHRENRNRLGRARQRTDHHSGQFVSQPQPKERKSNERHPSRPNYLRTSATWVDERTDSYLESTRKSGEIVQDDKRLTKMAGCHDDAR